MHLKISDKDDTTAYERVNAENYRYSSTLSGGNWEHGYFVRLAPGETKTVTIGYIVDADTNFDALYYLFSPANENNLVRAIKLDITD